MIKIRCRGSTPTIEGVRRYDEDGVYAGGERRSSVVRVHANVDNVVGRSK